MYRAIDPLDTEGILQEEWLNSRAAIARFDRGAIEIRCMDTQECPERGPGPVPLGHFRARHLMGTGEDLLAVHRKVARRPAQVPVPGNGQAGHGRGRARTFLSRAFGLGPKPTAGIS